MERYGSSNTPPRKRKKGKKFLVLLRDRREWQTTRRLVVSPDCFGKKVRIFVQETQPNFRIRFWRKITILLCGFAGPGFEPQDKWLQRPLSYL